MDGDIFGVRFEVDPNPPPGGPCSLADGTAVPVQLAVADGSSRGVKVRAERQAGARGEADHALVEQQHHRDGGRNQHGRRRPQLTAGERRESDGQHKQLGHQRPRPRPAESPEEEIRQRQKARLKRTGAAPSVKTAPQKDRTGAPVVSWKPYQPAATSRAVASAATIPGDHGDGAGPDAGSSRVRPAEARTVRQPAAAGSANGSEGFSGGLDTLAPYRT